MRGRLDDGRDPVRPGLTRLSIKAAVICKMQAIAVNSAQGAALCDVGACD